MKSNFKFAAVAAVLALGSVAASAQTFNSYLFDQMKAPATKTRAEVRAEVERADGQRTQAATASGSSYNGAVAQQAPVAAPVEKRDLAPQADAGLIKTSQQ